MKKEQLMHFMDWYDKTPNLSSFPMVQSEYEEVADQYLKDHPLKGNENAIEILKEEINNVHNRIMNDCAYPYPLRYWEDKIHHFTEAIKLLESKLKEK